MKKYICKGLIYQWFNSAKAVILLGLIAWGYMSHDFIGSKIEDARWQIAREFNNNFETFSINNYIFVFIIFVIIHLAGQGLSKRNNMMFLNSSPYTKKQIKYNEILCLILTGALFITMFVYMSVIRYINYRSLLSIVEGYFSVIGIEIIKMILFGIISVLYIMIVNSLFSNSTVGLICMVSVIPLSFFIMFGKIITILYYIPVNDGKNIFLLIDSMAKENITTTGLLVKSLIGSVAINEIRFSNIMINILVMLVIIAVLFVAYNKMQKINSLEYSTKIFSSKTNEKIIRILCSLGIGCFISLITVSTYIDKLYGNYAMRYQALSGVDLIKALSADILCIVIAAFICNIILKKILKVVE